MSDTTIDLPVLGMTCAACVRRVERAITGVPGVASAAVNLPMSSARIVGSATPATLAAAIREAGYEVPDDALDATKTGGAKLAVITRAEREEVGALRRDAAIAIGFAVPLIVIAMTGVLPALASVVAELALGTIVVLGPGRRYLRGGWIAVRHGAPDMNTLIALGAGAAWLSSVVVAVRWLGGPHVGRPEIYFEAGAAIVAFVMIGKVLEARARAQVSEAVRGLLSLAPGLAHRVVEDAETDVDASTLAAGDRIAIRPGERLPADGTVIGGTSAIDEAMLTGESLPVDKHEGSPVYAGTLNMHGALGVRVARAGADTALARIARAVEDAQGSKAPIARLADRVSAYFVPAVLVIAAITFAAWWLTGHAPGHALEIAIAVLVIACPCALGLATPAAVAVGTSRGAELGVLFSGGDALERASAIDVVCLDKTGTLTAGVPALVGDISDDVLRIAASVEQASEHPIARAVVAAAKARGLKLASPQNVVVEPGGGISATLDGKSVRVGSETFVVPRVLDAKAPRAPKGGDPEPASVPATIEPGGGVTASAGSEAFLHQRPPNAVEKNPLPDPLPLALWRQDLRAPQTSASGSEVLVAVDDEVIGAVLVADPPAATARATVDKLRAMGIEPVMITGDREAAARWIATEVGISNIHFAVKPTGKARIVAEQRVGNHRVAMVGDGINDAPALAAADVGIALGSGADLAAAAADITLLRGGIATLPTALGLARATLHAIRRNLGAAFIYNLVCIPIAAAGLASPMVASAAMSLSSVTVLLSSLRLKQWQMR